MAIKEYKGVIDDGTREIPLYNKFGKLICKVHIRLSDWSIVDRLEAFKADFANAVEPLKQISIKNDGTAESQDDWQAFKAVETEVKNQINKLFDLDDADDIFAARNPLSSVNGRFFCESVIEALGDIIVKALNDEAAATKERMDKYLSDLQEETAEDINIDRTATADA